MSERASTHGGAGSPGDSTRVADLLTPLDVLVLTVTLGVGAGLLHAVVVQAKGMLTHAFTWQGRNAIWMAPLGYVLVLSVPALVIAVVSAFRWRRATWRFAGLVLGFVALLGVGLLLRGVHWMAIVVLAFGAAWSWSGMIAAHAARWRRRLRASAVVLPLVSGVGALAGAARARLPAGGGVAPVDAPNVLIIILDTVRATSMGLYGYERETSPTIDTLSRTSVVFKNAMAPAPWTLLSHASMFTGQLPERLSTSWRRPLDATYPTLAEAFRAGGYTTGGFVANPFYTSSESGLNRGFDVYRDADFSLSQVLWSTTLGQTPLIDGLVWARSLPQVTRALRTFNLTVPAEPHSDRRLAQEVVPEFLAWHESLGARPFFAFINLYDAHDPYEPPMPWRRKFAPRPDKQALYDAGIAYMDDALDSLFTVLRQRGVLDRTIVVLSSDHGEQFGEHGLHNHGNSLYLPLLHVPLILRYPPAFPQGRRVDELVTTRDLAATLFELTGVPNKGQLPGTSLLRAMDDSVETRTSDAVAQTEAMDETNQAAPANRGDLAAILTEKLHLIRNGDGSFELYAHGEDPSELHNLADVPAWCDTARVLDARLRALTTRPAAPPYPATGCAPAPGPIKSHK